jgi:hypothetical protein
MVSTSRRIGHSEYSSKKVKKDKISVPRRGAVVGSFVRGIAAGAEGPALPTLAWPPALVHHGIAAP